MESQEELLDWKSLSFGYLPTDYNVRCYWRDGAWGEWEVSSSDMITIPMAATLRTRVLRGTQGLPWKGWEGAGLPPRGECPAHAADEPWDPHARATD